MTMGNEKEENLSPEEWAKRFDSPRQERGFRAVNNLFNAFVLNQNPNFYNNVSGAPYSQQNYYNPQFRDASSSANQGFATTTPAWSLRGEDYGLSPEAQKDTYKSNPFELQGVNQYPAPDSSQTYSDPNASYPNAEQQFPYQEQGTSNTSEDQTGQNPEYLNNLVLNQQEHFSEDFTLPVQPLTNKQEQEQLKELLRNKDIEALNIVLQLIDTTTTGIKAQRTQDNAEEADISENANELYSQSKDLYNRSKNLFILYAVAGELSVKSNAKQEMKQKAAELLKEIQENPIYSREINNEQERRDACERFGRFVGNTMSRAIGLGFGFGVAVGVASLMIPPAMMLYGTIMLAGPVVVAGAGGAGAFMADKLGYKIADLTLGNTAALAGRLLDWSKNGIRDLFKDKQQEKALTTLKNKLLQDIEKAQSGFIKAKNEYDQVKVKEKPDNEQIQKLQSQMTEHLENLYINASVLKELETSIVKQRQAEQKQKKALEEWKKTSLWKKATQKIGESDTWKSIREIGPRNICEKFGATTGKILGYAAAAGLAAAAAIFITSSIGASQQPFFMALWLL